MEEMVMSLKPLIYDLRFEHLRQWLEEQGEKSFRAGQIFDWLYVKRARSFDEMTNLSKGLRQLLSEHFAIEGLQVITQQESSDGTIKFLFSLHDGHAIETVI